MNGESIVTETMNNFKNWIQNQAQGESEFALSPAYREAALAEIRSGNFPTRKDEEWRYTPLAQVFDRPFSIRSHDKVSLNVAEKYKAAAPDAQHLIFVDGVFSSELSDDIQTLNQNGLKLSLIDQVDSETQMKIEQIIKSARLTDDNIFLHITQGLARTGLYIELMKNVELNRPLHILNLNTQSDEAAFINPINILHLNVNSRVKIVQQFASIDGSKSLTLPADYFQIDEGASLEIYKIGMESEETDHISNAYARLAGSASLNYHQYLLGSRLTRSNTEINFSGLGSEAVLRGLYLGDKSQHLDIRTYVDHAEPNCMSDQHFRGIMNDRSRGVFNGLVLVREHAQKTNAQQSNKNLLLSEDASVDTKPQLEIHADDVKCAHGATIGKLDEDALFYLQSRGISKADASLMLTRAFATEVTQVINLESLKDYIQSDIENRLMETKSLHA